MPAEHNFDLHLLGCLDALLTERKVTRAAERMNMTQPGMSHALARLRHLFKDPLLVRTAQGMVLTERALELVPSVRAALSHINFALVHPTEFVPQTARSTFRIAVSDYVSSLLLPRLIDRVLQDAPGVNVFTSVSDAHRFREWLEEGEFHMTLGYHPELSPGMHSSELMDDALCCIARREHSVIRGHLSLDQYLGAAHVQMVGGARAVTFERMIDAALTRLGLARRILLRVPSMLLIPDLVAGSDVLASVPRRLAKNRAAALGLQIFELPFDAPPFLLSMAWHVRTQQDAGQRWLRQRIRDVALELKASEVAAPDQTGSPYVVVPAAAPDPATKPRARRSKN
jgi:DNA-binding transcriptional LysR family regulator